MKQSALEGAFIFLGRVIGLDNYKVYEFMSRVVHLLDIIKMQMADGIDRMDSSLQMGGRNYFSG